MHLVVHLGCGLHHHVVTPFGALHVHEILLVVLLEDECRGCEFGSVEYAGTYGVGSTYDVRRG